MIKSLTAKKVLWCILVVIVATISLGFCIDKGTEYSLREKQGLVLSNSYKLYVVQSEVIKNERY